MTSKVELEKLIDRVHDLELARAADAPRRELDAAEFQIGLAVLRATESEWMKVLAEAVAADYERRVDAGEEV